ncbi:uncharacterized abhydrolase domain-containing protein DDB_G0269086 isoform X2 [Scaptodrosophila lebanonensis]|uniref:Uncharacterized abhydrolase domain-containing protein DDB_G0269086 isoform X2 n=1 Tax=Drosophila lebanonensis TaxID=7225 RepID=A0A6J2T5D9_DROLE|nr:uncharacterized abhydrolase domain-containing protein DDB_G0269086 isoform X2 [Scaptodrosophila lebanonensis]
MVVDIKMCRFDNVPWGFRLVGGADYDYPLTVVKVIEGSIADEAGLRVEDVIVRINDTAAMPLTHEEANRIIMNSGSVFYFGVYREQEEEEEEQQKQVEQSPKRFPLSESTATMAKEATNACMSDAVPQLSATAAAATERVEQVVVQEVEEDEEEPREVAESEVQSEDYRDSGALYLPDLPDRPCSVLSEQTEIKLVEEEIAAVLSGESEVLKEHNVLGIFPKPGVCMTSDVLRSLNEEVTKTKLEKEKENRKWSTFLQKPNRPVPKSKQQLEAERRAANAYKVKIVKSSARDKSPMPEVKPTPQEAKEATPPPPPAVEETKVEENKEEEVEEPLPTDSEVPNLEQLPGGSVVENTDVAAADAEDINSSNEKAGDDDVAETEAADDEQLEKADASKDESPTMPSDSSPPPSTPPSTTGSVAKTEEELALEKQLADVQKQLAALSSLPSTIQSTLDAVTRQLADLLPTLKLQQQQQQSSPSPPPQEPPHDEGTLPQIDEGVEGEDQQLAGGEHTAAVDKSESIILDDANDLEVAQISRSNGDNPQPELDGEQCLKKQKHKVRFET